MEDAPGEPTKSAALAAVATDHGGDVVRDVTDHGDVVSLADPESGLQQRGIVDRTGVE